MEINSKKGYARYLQSKFEEYFEDFCRKNNKTKEQLIFEYCGENSSKEDMYSIDTILNFLADYGSYYLYELELIEETNDYEKIEEIQTRIDEIDNEYDILERLIYNTGEEFIFEKEAGKIQSITEEEKQQAFKMEKYCTVNEMIEISNWLRYSYYTFVGNYRNTITTIKAGKSTYNFEMKEENICHLLGINKRKLINFLERNQITIFELFKMLMNDGEKINGETPLEKITRMQLGNDIPLFNYHMIKYKNYLFQNFEILGNASAICTNAKPKTNNNWLSDTFLLSKLTKKSGKDNYAQLGFFKKNKNEKGITCIPETLQSTNNITNGLGEVYNVKAIFRQAKGTVKDITETKLRISEMELCCIFSADEQLRMIEKILEEGAETLSKKNITELKIYYYRVYSAKTKFVKTRGLLKEKSLTNNGRKI